MYQSDSPFSVPLSKEEKWDMEFRDYGIKVMSDVALCYEVDEFFPRYVFIDRFFSQRSDKTEQSLFGDFTRGGITFFDREEKPFYPDKNNIDGFRWFVIEPRNFSLVKTYIIEHQPMQVMKNGIEGWIIPLSETERFEGWKDLNAYLHSLMFWESLLKQSEAGPIIERISWLSQNLYYQRNCVGQLSHVVFSSGLSYSVTPGTCIEELTMKVKDGVQRLKDRHEMELEKLKATLGKDIEKAHDRQIMISKLQELEKQQEIYYHEMAEQSQKMSSMFRSMLEHYTQEMYFIEKKQDERKDFFSTLSKYFKEMLEEENDTEK